MSDDDKSKVLEGYLEVLVEKQADLEMKLIESAVGIAEATSAEQQSAKAEEFDYIHDILERLQYASEVAELVAERSMDDDFYDEVTDEDDEDENAA